MLSWRRSPELAFRESSFSSGLCAIIPSTRSFGLENRNFEDFSQAEEVKKPGNQEKLLHLKEEPDGYYSG
jgi:hypothetical protein